MKVGRDGPWVSATNGYSLLMGPLAHIETSGNVLVERKRVSDTLVDRQLRLLLGFLLTRPRLFTS